MWNLDKIITHGSPFQVLSKTAVLSERRCLWLKQSSKPVTHFSHSICQHDSKASCSRLCFFLSVKPCSTEASKFASVFCSQWKLHYLAALGIIFFSIKERSEGPHSPARQPPGWSPLRRQCTHSVNYSWLTLRALSRCNCIKRGEWSLDL